MGGTSTSWECACRHKKLVENLDLSDNVTPADNVAGRASCCVATQPVQAVPPRGHYGRGATGLPGYPKIVVHLRVTESPREEVDFHILQRLRNEFAKWLITTQILTTARTIAR